MIRRQLSSTSTYSLFPDTTLFRSVFRRERLLLLGVTFDYQHAPGLGRHHAGNRARGQGQGEMPVRQGPRGRTQRLLRGAQVHIERRPEALQPADFIGELLGLHRHAIEVLRLGRAGRDGVRQERPFERQGSEENTSELQSLMRISYAVFCLKKKKQL